MGKLMSLRLDKSSLYLLPSTKSLGDAYIDVTNLALMNLHSFKGGATAEKEAVK